MTTPLILIVDDEPQNLSLLDFTLKEAGYQVAIANSGSVMFKILEKRQPALILCDVVMPEMDGYAVCERLKNSEQRDIPLIFLTSRTETSDLLKGFESGAVDYITKPFNKAELLARVRTHTELKQARDTILAHTNELEKLNQNLTTMNEQLISLNEEKNHFLAIAAHDLRNPLTNIMLSAEMIKFKGEKITPDVLQKYTQNIYDSAERMRQLITNLLDVNRIESGKLNINNQFFDCSDIVQRLTEQYREPAQRKQIKLILDLPNEPVALESDQQILLQIADNLLSNAIKYSPHGKHVHISLAQDQHGVSLQIRDQGPGFTSEDQQKLFQKFMRLSAQPTAGEHSTGLGLSIVKLLCEALQGQISCLSKPGEGALFTVALPFQPAV